MKTLIITLEYPPQIGGIASHTFNLANHLPPGETVVVAPEITGGTEFDSQYLWKTYRSKPYYYFFWPRWLRWYRQVKKICVKEKIEIILVQHALPGGYVAYLIKKFLKIPYRLFFHGSDLELGLRKKIRKLHVVVRGADKIFVNSEFLKQKLLSRFVNQGNVTVVYPAPGDHFFAEVDAEKVNLLKRQLGLEGKKILISVGRFADGKGFPHLVRLMRDIISNVPNAVLLLIGDGPKRAELIDLIQVHGLQNNIRFLGPVPNSELPLYYRASNVFVLLSHRDEKTEEGWGTVYLEAAACSLPVVAGTVGGVEEAVENLRTGILVDPYQDLQVIGAVSELLKQDDYARKIGEAGRERALCEFSWDKAVKLIIGG